MEDRNSSEPAFDFISPLTFIIPASVLGLMILFNQRLRIAVIIPELEACLA